MVVDLPKPTLDKLSALEDSILRKFGAATRAAAEKDLLAMTEEQRAKALAQDNYQQYFPSMDTDEWDTEAEKLLTPEEAKALAAREGGPPGTAGGGDREGGAGADG